MLAREEKREYESKHVDQDGLWKKVIEELLEEFLLFFMPKLHGQIDFTKQTTFLDKELFQEVVDEKKGRRYADQLVKVCLKNGEEKWILIHIEIQGSKEANFPMRMFQYFYRIYDRHEEEIVALALHTSKVSIEGMEQFDYASFGTTLKYSYNNYRIENYSVLALTRSKNIFSKVMLAAKAMNETKGKNEERYEFKLKLMEELIESKQYDYPMIIATVYFHSAENSDLYRWRELAVEFFIHRVSKLLLKENKVSGGCHGFLRGDFRACSKKSGRNHAEA